MFTKVREAQLFAGGDVALGENSEQRLVGVGIIDVDRCNVAVGVAAVILGTCQDIVQYAMVHNCLPDIS